MSGSQALPLLTSAERREARQLIESQGLSFEDDCDDFVGIYDEGRLVAAAGRAGYVLKMFAIDESAQGAGTLGQLTAALVELARGAGFDSTLIYTRPRHAASFQACGFELLVACGGVVLLEHGGGLETYLRGLPRRSPDGAEAGCIVVNGNPFTRGHLYLVETAAAQVPHLYLFVVREDRSIFPFEMRYRMAAAATRHLPNVVLLDTSRYAVSAGTFPSYFLKDGALTPSASAVRHAAVGEAARLQMEVDARLFGAHIAPALGITSRFVGHEPYCATTEAYNAALGELLPQYGVTLRVVQRLGDDSGFVSATRVRAALATGDIATVGRLVPDTTLEILVQALKASQPGADRAGSPGPGAHSRQVSSNEHHHEGHGRDDAVQRPGGAGGAG